MNPYLVKGIVGLVIVAVIFGAGYKVATWKWSGKVAEAVADKETAEKIAAEKTALEAQWREDVANVKLELDKMTVARDLAQSLYDSAVSKPPEVVVRYRDRWHTADDTIVSTDCVEGVGQLFTFLQSLPERPR